MALDILIVDDEDDIRDLIAGILEDEGPAAHDHRQSWDHKPHTSTAVL